ncbi:hypothetical protein [Cognatilysobacter lacus]|uniref:Secreted protein n=1 Tax=Cognatilysobacter lacus TaxID=1643323 RepID=A0A5D8YQA6_9GAMM|nr:hypothetical protein [Lysobacter lacus]TZF84162.1 hypothetical protein FW784_12865 [Lysobacter lacus]
MKNTHRPFLLLLLAVLALPVLSGCKKEEVTTTKAEGPAVAKPATAADEAGWNAYVTDQVKRHLEGATSVFAYTLPAPDSKDFAGDFQRQVDKAKEDVARGGVDGTLLAFGSANSAKTADMIVAAFDKAGTDTMKGVRVLFIGDAADKDRAEAAVKPSGAKFEFAEAK